MIIMEKEESSNKVLHAVDIRAAKRKRSQLVRELELGDYDYYPRYLRIVPYILEDIL